mmetsp:Transcript_12139/g.24987  ORF Transcript_12139/g.24987 Transcript_12139/m.24987 type:complete len:81 (+) Transcript_12139:217-459(+)
MVAIFITARGSEERADGVVTLRNVRMTRTQTEVHATDMAVVAVANVVTVDADVEAIAEVIISSYVGLEYNSSAAFSLYIF